MEEKVFIVISNWFYEKSGYYDKSINLVTRDKNKAIEKLKAIKEEELAINGRLWDEDIFEKKDGPNYFFIMNNSGNWFEIEIIENEID